MGNKVIENKDNKLNLIGRSGSGTGTSISLPRN